MSKYQEVFRSDRDLITFQAAYGHLVKEGQVDPSGYVKLSDLRDLMVKKPTIAPRAWSFKGDWKKSVAPIFNAA